MRSSRVDELKVANAERVARSAAHGRTEAEISGARREDFRRRRRRSALQAPRDTRVAPGDLRGLHRRSWALKPPERVLYALPRASRLVAAPDPMGVILGGREEPPKSYSTLKEYSSHRS